jgi:RNA polymerase sigma factor (sigma-70 family)
MDVNQSNFGLSSVLAIEPGFVARTDIKSAYLISNVYAYSINAVELLGLQSSRMTPEQELAYITRAQQGDQAAIAELVQKFAPFIVSVVKQYSGRGILYKDLINAGSLGFLEAIKTYEPNFNSRLSTWSYYSIKKEAAALVEGGLIIKIPRRKFAKLCEIKRRFQDGEKVNAIARAMELSTDEVLEIYDEAQNLAMYSLDTSMVDDDSMSMHEVVPDEDEGYTEQGIIDAETAQQLDQFLSQLNAWECQLICMRMGARGYDGEHTLDQVAHELNQTGQYCNGREWNKELVRVKQIDVLNKLKRLVSNHEKGILSSVSMFEQSPKADCQLSKGLNEDNDEGFEDNNSFRM